MPVKYTDELRARGVDLVLRAQSNPETSHGAITHVAEELGLSYETLRMWVRKHKGTGTRATSESTDLVSENGACAPS